MVRGTTPGGRKLSRKRMVKKAVKGEGWNSNNWWIKSAVKQAGSQERALKLGRAGFQFYTIYDLWIHPKTGAVFKGGKLTYKGKKPT